MRPQNCAPWPWACITAASTPTLAPLSRRRYAVGTPRRMPGHERQERDLDVVGRHVGLERGGGLGPVVEIATSPLLRLARAAGPFA